MIELLQVLQRLIKSESTHTVFTENPHEKIGVLWIEESGITYCIKIKTVPYDLEDAIVSSDNPNLNVKS